MTNYKSSPNYNPAIEAHLAAAQDWREAVRLDIDRRVENNLCFSSGNIATDLRVYRPDFAFSVQGLGEYVRDLYASGECPSYKDPNGLSAYPLQVPQITTGVALNFDGEHVQGRTPAGTPVFVYGPDQATCDAFAFETYIPLPPGQTDNPTPLPGPAGTPGSLPALPTTPKQLGLLITGKLAKEDLTATVRQDGRLCVSRAAFEAFVALNGKPLRAGPNGDPVYINVEGTPAEKVIITLDASPGCEEYHLWVNRGRIAFAPPTGTEWKAETKYAVTVDANQITVDVTKTI